MIHIYTLGRKSIQFLIMTKKQAAVINQCTRAYLEAQEHFLEKNGRYWTPSDPLHFDEFLASRELLIKHNKIANLLDFQHKIRNWIFALLRVDVKNEEIGDYLIKRF